MFVQSKVEIGFSPTPLIPPVTVARLKLSGFIQVIQLKVLKASKRYVGNQLYTNMAVAVM